MDRLPAGREADGGRTAAAHYKQGKAFLDAKQYDQAIIEFQAAYAIDKRSSHLFNIADSYDRKGDHERAVEYYQKYLDAEPKTERAAEVRGRIAVATQARADAAAKRKADEQAAALEAKRIAGLVHVKQAAAYEQAGTWGKAGDEHRQAFTVDGNPLHLLAAAEAYRKHGDLAKARDAYAAYLDKVPLGDTSDATRLKLAEVTREIEKAEQIKRTPRGVTPVKQPPKPRNARVASMAGNATTAARRGDCSVAKSLAKQVQREDPAYHEEVVIPALGACALPTRTGSPGIGGGFELRLGVVRSADLVEAGSVAAKAQPGKPPSTAGIAGFLDFAASPRLRVRVGIRVDIDNAGFDERSCSASASVCPSKLNGKFGGPAFSVEPAIYRDGAVRVHLVFGGALGIPLGNGTLELSMSQGDDPSRDIALKTQIEIDAGIGFRSGRLFANVVFTATPTALTDELDVGAAKSVGISFGLTTLR